MQPHTPARSWYARRMSGLHDERGTGTRTPFLIGAQAALILLALPCAVSPSFRTMYEDFWDVLPLVSVVVLNPLYAIVTAFMVLGMLMSAHFQRDRLARPALLAWCAVLLGACSLLLYVFGLLAPMRPL